MNKKLRILIVDDHPMTVDGYINVLSEEGFPGYELTFNKALNCKEAFEIITNKETKPDVAYLDLSLPPYPEEKIFSGLDLGILLRKTYPDCTIIFLTMHSESSLIERLIAATNPQGILCKSDIDIDEFVKAFHIIFGGQKHYSNKIQKSLKDRALDNFKLDSYDRQILMRLSEGIAKTNIPNYVPLSLDNITERIDNVKKLILKDESTDSNSDAALVEAVKKMGIL
ncbi:response regulator transcription factor [Flavobacterium sp. RHBU_3]|uniref:response regulator n=1 Tax=Flavobacterium sp. RHBU_3 TaxID=3391184 RepID=UPI0039854393